MRSIAPIGSGIIRDVVIPLTPLTMDHIGQSIPSVPCHDERGLPIGCHRVQVSLKIVVFTTRSAPMSSGLSMPRASAVLTESLGLCDMAAS